MILIEGSDNTGKTTLANAIARAYKMPTVHWGPMPSWWRYVDYLTKLMPFAVYDRYHWSEAAYDFAAQRNRRLVSAQECQQLDEALRSRCADRYYRILLYSSKDEYFPMPGGLCREEMFSREIIIRANQFFREHLKDFDVTHDVSKGYADADWIISLVQP